MPATDVTSSGLAVDGGFVAAVRPTDLVYFALNVGDGDTQLLLLPANSAGQRRCIVVDCIRAPKLFALIEALAATPLLPAIEPLLELVVATHPHDDHISGMAALLRRFGDGHIREVWESGYYQPSAAYLEMMRELEDRDISTLQPASGTMRFLGQVKLTVLAPGIGLRNRFDSYGVNVNNASIALKVEFPAARTYQRAADRTYLKLPTTQSLILGADSQTLSWSQAMVDFPQLDAVKTAVTTALRRANGTTPLDASVFKVPHHGSKHGLSLELVESIRPALSIVSSVHEGGKYDFPHEVSQAALREALDPISSKPGGAHKDDSDLIILYTGSRELAADGSTVGPLGTVAVLVGAGGRREIWRFRDGAEADVSLAAGRPMLAAPSG